MPGSVGSGRMPFEVSADLSRGVGALEGGEIHHPDRQL